MSYCLLQTEAIPLPVDALKRAFAAVKGLTEIDGLKAAQETWGIVVKHLTRETAQALQQALQERGVGVESVETSQLPRLPDARCIRRAEIQPETLLVYDPLGRAVPVPWRQVTLIAAGGVQHFGLARTSTQEWVRDSSVSSSLGLTGGMILQTDVRHQFHNQMEFLLDLLIGTASMRFQIEAANFGFKHVFDRPELDLAGKVDELIQRLAEHAPHALLNQGARAARERAPTRRPYPSKAAFFDEEIWLLWRQLRPRAGSSLAAS